MLGGQLTMLKNTVLEQRLSEAETGAVCSVLVTRLGGSYSRLLGLKLGGMQSDETFKWFVAAVLLGSPVRTGSALSAYREMERRNLLTPRGLLEADETVLYEALLTSGVTGYTRRIAGILHSAVESLVSDYDGDINRLHFFAEDGENLVVRVRELGNKVPRRAVALFMREMRGVWEKAQPGLSLSALEAARCLGVIDSARAGEAVDELRSVWERGDHGGRTYADFEVALVRLGENYCSMRRCVLCPMGKLCVSRTSRSANDS